MKTHMLDERERAKISVTLTCTSTTARTAASGNKKNNGLTTRAKQKNLFKINCNKKRWKN